MSAYRTITLSSRSVVTLIDHYLLRSIRLWLTYFCQQRQVTVSLSTYKLSDPIFVNPIADSLLNGDICSYCSRICLRGVGSVHKGRRIHIHVDLLCFMQLLDTPL
ncbi:hypothetical protein TNCV_678431 [Trichonephila clavipes]|nr:hypothetical protein TNCV_678431 [Trichonephila clavipes]